MLIPTEPIGSIPRPTALIAAVGAHAAGRLGAEALERAYEEAVADTVARLVITGSPVVTDGEQRKPSFATYPVDGSDALDGDGVVIPFADGHVRQLPRLTRGPFRYQRTAAGYLREARRHTALPVKQAVISASALSLLYPASGIDGYPQETFVEDLVREATDDLRSCLAAGAHCVQIDFTEGRLAVKLDPSLGLLRTFVGLNNRVLDGLTEAERSRVGVHTCPGGDHDSTHSADVDYVRFLPELFALNVPMFYVQLASEPDRVRALEVLGRLATGDRRIFVGVTDPCDPRVETPEIVRDRVLEAARYIDVARLGTTDDCGFSPFGDDTSTSRDTAFAKIAARVQGTVLAAEVLGI